VALAAPPLSELPLTGAASLFVAFALPADAVLADAPPAVALPIPALTG
jgi:hypothetical protein